MGEHKTIKILLCIVAVVFVVHQIYSSAYKPIQTVSAQYYAMTEGFDINAFIIREEQYVTSNSGGTMHYVISDGERVAKGGTIANIYSSAEASTAINRIEQLKSRIADIEAIQGYNDVEAANLALANTKITNSLNELLRSVAANNFSEVDKHSSELLTNISRKQMITGEQTDFNALLESLKSELSALNASLPAVQGSVNADRSGYFVSATDGYESVLNGLSAESITPEFLEGIEKSEVPQNAIGKLVSGYNWYIAAVVDINSSMKYKEGDLLTVSTNLKSIEQLDVTVEKINSSSDSDRAVIVLSCGQMNSELASMRRGNMTIIENTYSGLKIPSKALRVNDGKTGVYVRSGSTLKFVEVDVVYRNDEYIICKQHTANDETVLRLYDDVVVKGKRLYDGKIVE